MLINDSAPKFNTPLPASTQTPKQELSTCITIASPDSVNVAIAIVKTHFPDQEDLSNLLTAFKPIVASKTSGLEEKMEMKAAILKYISETL